MTIETCPQCGKRFGITNRGEYAYRFTFRKKLYVFCSYKCMTEFERENGKKRNFLTARKEKDPNQ